MYINDCIEEEQVIREVRENAHVAWGQIHQTFERYGRYFPSEDSWTNVGKFGEGEGPRTTTKTAIAEYTGLLSSYGIAPLMYYEFASADVDLARRDFESDIGLDARGKPLIGNWPRVIDLNAVEGNGWCRTRCTSKHSNTVLRPCCS